MPPNRELLLCCSFALSNGHLLVFYRRSRSETNIWTISDCWKPELSENSPVKLACGKCWFIKTYVFPPKVSISANIWWNLVCQACLGMTGFLPACLLTSWEVQFPSLLHVLLLKSSELDSYLSGGLSLVDVCRICDHSESQSSQVPTSGVCAGCLAPILLHSCGAKWSWIFGPSSQDRLRKGLWVL